MFRILLTLALSCCAVHANGAESKSRSKTTSTQFRKRPKNVPLKKPKPRPFKGVCHFSWPKGLEIFSTECPNRGVIEEIYGTNPKLYEVRVTCKGDIDRYEHFFLIPQSLVIKITNK